MTREEFLKDVCPNHTDKSKWNKSELLHILEIYKEQLRSDNTKNEIQFLNEILSHLNNVDGDLFEYQCNVEDLELIVSKRIKELQSK